MKHILHSLTGPIQTSATSEQVHILFKRFLFRALLPLALAPRALFAPIPEEICSNRPIRVAENAGLVRVEVIRDDTNNPAKAEFYTQDSSWLSASVFVRSAQAGVDYQATSGAIAFEAGQPSAVIEVPILDNPVVDGSRYFDVVVTNFIPKLPSDYDRLYTIKIEDNEISPRLDPTFNPEMAPGPNAYGEIVITPLASGSILLSQDRRVFDANRFDRWPGLTQLKLDGSIDFGFKPSLQNLWPIDMVSDGSALLTDFVYPVSRLVHFTPGGNLDWQISVTNLMRARFAPDGDIYVLRRRGDGLQMLLRRLKSDGRDDARFPELSFPWVPNLAPAILEVQPDGAILLTTDTVGHINGETNRFLVRLHSDGSLDDNFRPQLKQPNIGKIYQLPGGKLLLAGWFEIDGQATASEVCLNSDGTPDLKCTDPLKSNGFEYALAPLPDNSFIGIQESCEEVMVARLNADGSSDPEFVLRFSLERGRRYWPAVAVTQQGETLVAAPFDNIPGVSYPCNGLIRLRSHPPSYDFRVIQPARFFRPPGVARLQIMRAGDTSLSASVTFTTRDGSAKAGAEYEASSGSLTFEPFEVAKEILIPLLPPQDQKSRELLVELSQPSLGYSLTAPTRVRIAPLAEIVPESIYLVQEAQPHGPYAAFTVRYATPAHPPTVYSSGDLQHWRNIGALNSDGTPENVTVPFQTLLEDSEISQDTSKRFFRLVEKGQVSP